MTPEKLDRLIESLRNSSSDALYEPSPLEVKV